MAQQPERTRNHSPRQAAGVPLALSGVVPKRVATPGDFVEAITRGIWQGSTAEKRMTQDTATWRRNRYPPPPLPVCSVSRYEVKSWREQDATAVPQIRVEQGARQRRGEQRAIKVQAEQWSEAPPYLLWSSRARGRRSTCPARERIRYISIFWVEQGAAEVRPE